MRNNQITPEDIAILNQYVKPDFDLKANKGYITLTTHNAKADSMNAQALEDLEGKLVKYNPEITGDFPDKIFPVDEQLQLKVGAQIMFVKNDLSFDKKFFNGKMGIVKSLSSHAANRSWAACRTLRCDEEGISRRRDQDIPPLEWRT